MTQTYITTIYNGPSVVKFLRTRQLNQDFACSDFTEHNESSPAASSPLGGRTLGLLSIFGPLFFLRRRTSAPANESNQYESPFL